MPPNPVAQALTPTATSAPFLLPIRVDKVLATGTSASGIVGLY